ncbi:MAG: hypothetical protein AAFR11_05180 [Pseudomonadota bacterium]
MKTILSAGAVAGLLAACTTGITGYEVVNEETAVDSTPQKQLIVECPTGKVATGGGWAVLDPTSAILSGRATTNQPAFDGKHWLVNAINESDFSPTWKLKVWAICVTPEAAG